MTTEIEQRPAVLQGGTAIIQPGEPFRVTWDGKEPRVAPRVPDAPWEPQWPTAGIEEGKGLVDLTLSGKPLGYLGECERKLERRVARLAGDQTLVLTCSTGTTALEIAYTAVMTAAMLQGKQLPDNPEVITTPLSFQATWTQMLKTGLRPVFMDVSASTACIEAEDAEGYVNENTVGVVVTPLYERSPDLRAWRKFAKEHGLFLIVDGAHAPFATWEGKHAAWWCDVFTTSNQQSKIWTTGSEGGFVMTREKLLAALMAMIRNCGRQPDRLPWWWPSQAELPRDFIVSGDNFRSDELRAVILDVALDRYRVEAPTREEQVRLVRRFIAGRPELPVSLMPEQPEFGGGPYKVALLYDEHPWGMPRGKFTEWLSRELTVEVADAYALPWEPKSGFHPASRPWAWDRLVPRMEPQEYPNAVQYAAEAALLPHEFFLRKDFLGMNAADQLGRALLKMEHWHGAPEIRAWANRPGA